MKIKEYWAKFVNWLKGKKWGLPVWGWLLILVVGVPVLIWVLIKTVFKRPRRKKAK